MTADGPGGAGTRGFALILVVWILVLIGAIGSFMVANGRAEIAIAHNVQAAARAEALADAGVARAIFNQIDSEPNNRWKLDGASHSIELPAGRIEIRLGDETRKINPNLASASLLAALFEVRGMAHDAAQGLGAAVADWVNPKQSATGAPDLYRAAGRSYEPPHAPIASLDELGLVLGMTPQILASVRPYLSVYSGAAAPDARSAPPVIQRALAMSAGAAGADSGAGRPSLPSLPANIPQPTLIAPLKLPAASAAPDSEAGADPVIEAQIVAHGSDGGIFVRHAVVKLQDDGKAYTVLDWKRGTLN